MQEGAWEHVRTFSLGLFLFVAPSNAREGSLENEHKGALRHERSREMHADVDRVVFANVSDKANHMFVQHRDGLHCQYHTCVHSAYPLLVSIHPERRLLALEDARLGRDDEGSAVC